MLSIVTLYLCMIIVKAFDLCTPANVTGGANLNNVQITHTNLDIYQNVECSMVLYEGPAVTGEVLVKIDFYKFKCSTPDAQSLNIYKDGCLGSAIKCTTSGDIGLIPPLVIYSLDPDEELYIKYISEINQRTSELEIEVSYLDYPDGASDGTIFLGLPIDYQTTKTEAECNPTTTTTTTTTIPPTPPPTVGTTAATVDPGVTPAETEAPTEDPNNPDLTESTSTTTRPSTTTEAGGGDSGSDANTIQVQNISNYIGSLAGCVIIGMSVGIVITLTIISIIRKYKQSRRTPNDDQVYSDTTNVPASGHLTTTREQNDQNVSVYDMVDDNSAHINGPHDMADDFNSNLSHYEATVAQPYEDVKTFYHEANPYDGLQKIQRP